MGRALAESVRGVCRAVAVGNAYQLAPWADALVCWDRAWWRVHPDALEFAGRKFCGGKIPGGEPLPHSDEFPVGCNSGYRAMGVARDLGADRILLLGFDLAGGHYFGDHPPPLRNAPLAKYRAYVREFDLWRGGCAVLNCTPGSALHRFQQASLEEALA